MEKVKGEVGGRGKGGEKAAVVPDWEASLRHEHSREWRTQAGKAEPRQEVCAGRSLA